MTRSQASCLCLVLALGLIPSCAMMLIPMNCPKSPPATASPDARYPYLVPFEIGVQEFTNGNSLAIQELWGTRPEIATGGEYLVVGTYELQSADEGWIYYFMTGDGWDNSGPVEPTQTVHVQRGSGSFRLEHDRLGPGWFHVELHGGSTGTGEELADVYFGSGDSLLVAKNW